MTPRPWDNAIIEMKAKNYRWADIARYIRVHFNVERTPAALQARYLRYLKPMVEERGPPEEYLLATRRPWVSKAARRRIDDHWFRMNRSRYQPQNPEIDISTVSSQS